jgi:hypothetical protein
MGEGPRFQHRLRSEKLCTVPRRKANTEEAEMFGIMVKTTQSLLGKSSGRLKLLLGAAFGLSMASFAHGQILFTTVSDFTGWTANSPGTGATASSAYDFDGTTSNGLGNNPGNSGPSINPGGASTGGSMLVSFSSLGYSELAFSPGEHYNNYFMSAVDPGSTTAYSAASSYGPGSTVAYSGTMYLVYTTPSASNGSYLQMGVNLDYPADGYYQMFFGSSVSDGTVDGYTTYTDTIPYTITAGAGNLTNFQMAIASNSNSSLAGSMYIDDISLSPPVAAVPEPATLGMLGAGVTMLTLRRRRQA